MSTYNDKRLQALFQMIGGSDSAHEIATAVQKIKDHLGQSGRTFRDLEVTPKGTTTNVTPTIDAAEAAEVMRDADKALRESEELLERIAEKDPRSLRAKKKLRRVETQRDVLATFLSPRVLEVAMLQAEAISAREEKGEDVAKSFGRPGWANKAGSRPDRHWGF